MFLRLGCAFLLAAPFPAVAADAAAGKAKSGQCATCHGVDGLSKLPNAPSLAGQPEMYLSAQMTAYRDGTRKDPMMNVITKTLKDEDIANLAAWYASIEVTAKVPD